jgi:hypothetical protein
MTVTKQFSLDVILSVIYGQQMPGTGDADLRSIVQFMEHRVLFDAEIAEAVIRCKEDLLRQYPLFDMPEEWQDFHDTEKEVQAAVGTGEADDIIRQWRNRRTMWYGENLWVMRLQPERK